jgi:hypothetical protein
MIRQSLVVLASCIAALATAAEADPAAKQLQVFPKNLARQHLGANLFIFNPTTQTFSTTEAAAAWLDDDVSTGWAALAGKQHYLMALPEPEVVTNFALSTKSSGGTVTIYGGDEPAAPGAKSWVPLVRDVSIDTVNQKKLSRPFNRLAKYVLIETNIPEPGPIFGLYLYGDRPATSYTLIKRDQPIDTKAIFGPYVNDQTAFSHSALYSGGRVAFATDKSSYSGWQRAIDDNPESAISIAATKDEAGMVLALSGKHPISRMAVLADGGANGKLEVFLVPDVPQNAANADASGNAGVPAITRTNSSPVTHAVSLAGLSPALTFEFDGSTSRMNKDFAATEAGAVLLRWTPTSGGQALVIREINAFNGYSLADYSLTLTPEAIAELAQDASKDGKAFADGKEGKDAKGLAPVGELFNSKKPYLPPSLGFPPPIPPRVPPKALSE